MASQGRFGWFRRHKVWTVIIVLLLLGGIGAAAGGGNNTNNNSGANNNSSSNSSGSKAKTTAKIGEPARDGKFEFTVNSIKCGQANVGHDYLTKTAQGQYCLLAVTVRNIGNEAQSLYSGNQYLFNSAGQKYSADDSATFTAAPSGNTWYDNINPGNSVEGNIVFDIPKDQTPVSAELHDSALSGGVKVNLQ